MAEEKDIVLIYFEDKPIIFARIEDILPDAKMNWYHVKLLVFQVPLRTVTWILKDSYINGGEFTMGGQKVRMEKVVCPEDSGSEKTSTKENIKAMDDSESAKVISLKDIKKK